MYQKPSAATDDGSSRTGGRPVLTDGGSNSGPDSDGTGDGTKNRAAKFHEKSGGFEDVGKAVLILLLIALVAYLVFVVF